MKPIPRLILRVFRTLLLAWLVGGILLFVFQRKLLYLPSENIKHNYLSFNIPVHHANLNVIVLNPKQDQALLYFGGNAESVVYNAAYFQQKLPNTTVYLVNYRGYGSSTGTPNETDFFADSLQLYDLFRPQHKEIIVLGRSLGSGVAGYLATQRPVSRLILATPYDSIRAVAQARYPFYPIGLMLHDHFDTLSRADQINARTLVLLAEHDTVVPHKHAEKLIDALKNKQVATIPNTAHDDITDSEAFYRHVSDFLK